MNPVRKRRYKGFILLLLTASLPLSAAAQSFDFEHITTTLTKEIKAMIDDTGIPSISIALLKNDSIIWQQAFGSSNVKLNIPASPNTIYNTGSCFKPVTSIAVNIKMRYC